MTAKKNRKNNIISEKMKSRLNIRISGSGGQGIVSIGMLLGRAIAIGDRKNVSQSQTYGAEARGGAASSDIIVSDGEVYFPSCDLVDLLVVFTYSAYEQNAPIVNLEGIIIADDSAVDVLVGNATTLKIPFMKIAREKFSSEITANMISLGFLSSYLSIVSENSLINEIKEEYTGSKHLDLNIKGIKEGVKLGEEYLKEEKNNK